MPNTLLHCCCAPCSVRCIEDLRGEGIEPTAYWYNPTIHPYQEYKARRDTLVSYAPTIAMALVGAILADVPLKTVFDPRCFYLVAVRQFLLPGICLAALRLLGMDALPNGVSVVITGMPIGSTTAILAQKYGADAQFASKCVFISTLTTLVTVPI